jgi:hypothetical protein
MRNSRNVINNAKWHFLHEKQVNDLVQFARIRPIWITFQKPFGSRSSVWQVFALLSEPAYKHPTISVFAVEKREIRTLLKSLAAPDAPNLWNEKRPNLAKFPRIWKSQERRRRKWCLHWWQRLIPIPERPFYAHSQLRQICLYAIFCIWFSGKLL